MGKVVIPYRLKEIKKKLKFKKEAKNISISLIIQNIFVGLLLIYIIGFEILERTKAASIDLNSSETIIISLIIIFNIFIIIQNIFYFIIRKASNEKLMLNR